MCWLWGWLGHAVMWSEVQPSMCVDSGASWVGLPCKSMSDTALTGPGQPVWNSKTVDSLLLSLLALGMHGRGQAAHPGCLSPGLVWGQVRKRPREPWGPPPPPGCLPGSGTERASVSICTVWGRFSVSYLVGQLFSRFHPYYQSRCSFFCKSLVIRLFSSASPQLDIQGDCSTI